MKWKHSVPGYGFVLVAAVVGGSGYGEHETYRRSSQSANERFSVAYADFERAPLQNITFGSDIESSFRKQFGCDAQTPEGQAILAVMHRENPLRVFAPTKERGYAIPSLPDLRAPVYSAPKVRCYK